MSKVTFRSKQPYFQLSYMDVFKVGFITVPVVGGKPYKDNGNPNIDYAKCEESTAEGKTFSFSRGEKQNRYITNDAEEIKILRDYIKTRVDNMFTEVRE